MIIRRLIEFDLSRNKQNAINIGASLTTFAITSIIGFFLSPYIVKTIGVEANGFVSLAYNFTTYAALATTALNSMSSRFLMMAYYQNKMEKVERIYSSVFFANLIIATGLSFIAIFVVIYLEHLLIIPGEILFSVKMLFATIFANFILSTSITSWAATPYIKNRLYLTSIADATNAIIKACIIVLLFSLFTPSVSFVGIATFLASCLLIAYYYYCKKILLPFRAKISLFSFSEIKKIISSGVWNSISSLGNILIHGIDLLLANIFLGATEMGILAIAKTMPLIIGALNETIANVFTPSFIIDYSKHEVDNIVKTVKQSAKLISVICTIPLSFLFVFGQEFYSLWQPTLDARTLLFLSCITIFGRVLFTGMQPLFNIFTVVDKVKQNSIITILNGVVSCIITVICLNFTNLGIWAIAGVSVICCALKNVFFVIPFSAHYLRLPKRTFLYTIYPSVLCTIILLVFGLVVKSFFSCNNWLMLCLCGILFTIIGFIITAYVVLTKNERTILLNKIFKRQ